MPYDVKGTNVAEISAFLDDYLTPANMVPEEVALTWFRAVTSNPILSIELELYAKVTSTDKEHLATQLVTGFEMGLAFAEFRRLHPDSVYTEDSNLDGAFGIVLTGFGEGKHVFPISYETREAAVSAIDDAIADAEKKRDKVNGINVVEYSKPVVFERGVENPVDVAAKHSVGYRTGGGSKTGIMDSISAIINQIPLGGGPRC